MVGNYLNAKKEFRSLESRKNVKTSFKLSVLFYIYFGENFSMSTNKNCEEKMLSNLCINFEKLCNNFFWPVKSSLNHFSDVRNIFQEIFMLYLAEIN